MPRWVIPAVAITGVVVVAAVVAAFAFGGEHPDSDAEPTHVPETAASDGCSGVDAESIELNGQLTSPSDRTCFVLDQTAEVLVSAAALEPTDAIVLTVIDADGNELGRDESTPDWDPDVTVVLEPGVYVIEVTGADGAAAPPFLLFTASFVPQTSGGGGIETDPVELPTVEQCGTDIPWLTADARVTARGLADLGGGQGEASGASYACIDVPDAVFAKIGIESEVPDDPDTPDLALALWAFGAGEPEFLRASDDVFGFDPEMSIELEPGVYLVEGSAWRTAETGEFEFYYDDAAALFRKGEVTPEHAQLTPEHCKQTPIVTPGDSITVEGERTYLCMDVDSATRLTIQAATLTRQDLMLEVIGFDDEGPYRLAWADDNPYSQSLADFDPLLDIPVPEGQWVLAVTTYFDGIAADYDVRVVAGGGE